MNWIRVNRSGRTQPARGVYTDWKQQISDECSNRCVYCAIPESRWGGIDHYHTDHFRPKSIAEFYSLINKIENLYHACPICNRFKGDDWPGETGDLALVCYPDPSDYWYGDLFQLDPLFTLTGRSVAARYVLERLYLNRPQLVYARREAALEERYLAVNRVSAEVQSIANRDELEKLLTLTQALLTHIIEGRNIPPYRLAEIRRPPNNA